MAARADPEVAATIVAATAVKAEAAAQEALGDANLQTANVEEHLNTDATLQGLPHMDAVQTKAIAESVRILVDQQLGAMNKAWEQRFAKLKEETSDEEGESELIPAEEGDAAGYKAVLSKGQQKKAAAAKRRANADPNQMVDDAAERKAAKKRPADEQATDEAEKEREAAATAGKGITAD